MLVNVNVIYYGHVCEQARWARSAGNSATENVCIIIICGKWTECWCREGRWISWNEIRMLMRMSISTVYDSTDLNAEWVHWRLFRKNEINRESGEIDFLLKVGRFMFHSKWGDWLFIQSGEIYLSLKVGRLTLFLNSKWGYLLFTQSGEIYTLLKVGRFTLYSKWGDLPFTQLTAGWNKLLGKLESKCFT